MADVAPKARCKTEVAEEALRIGLADGPRRPRDVKALAAEAGLTIREEVWQRARHRLAVATTRRGRDFFWSLPPSTEETDDLLAGIERRLALQVEFEQFLAERDRVPGGQLALTL